MQYISFLILFMSRTSSGCGLLLLISSACNNPYDSLRNVSKRRLLFSLIELSHHIRISGNAGVVISKPRLLFITWHLQPSKLITGLLQVFLCPPFSPRSIKSCLMCGEAFSLKFYERTTLIRRVEGEI